MKVAQSLEYLVVLLLIAYIGIALSRWPGFVEALTTPETFAAMVVIVFASAWFSPVVATFLVLAIIATLLVNEVARRSGAEPIARIASVSDFLDEYPTVWPYVPSPDTGSNVVAF